MFKAISTKFYGPTNTRGSRIGVSAPDNRTRLFDFGHELRHDERHTHCAKLYATEQNWPGLYVAGYVAGSGYVFVNTGRDITPSMIAGHTLAHHPLGFEGVDWFHVAPREGK